MDSTQYITLDVMDNKIFDYIYTKQYDIGRTIVFTITKNGEQMNLSGLSAIFSMAKPDGNIILNSSTDDEIIINPDNTITLVLFDQMTVLAGKLPYQISLLDGTKVVSTVTGYIYCDKAPVQRDMAESVSAGSLMENLAVVAQAIKDGDIHSGDIVSASAEYNSGTKVGEVTVNTVKTNFYIPDEVKQTELYEDSDYNLLFGGSGASALIYKNNYLKYNPDVKNLTIGTGLGFYNFDPAINVIKDDGGYTSTQTTITANDITSTIKWDGEHGQYNSLHGAMEYLFGHIGDSQINVNAVRVNSTTYNPVSGLVTLPPYPTTLPASNTTSVYSASGTAPVNGTAVASAISALDGVVTGTAGAGKTLTAFSQTDGVVSATFGDIAITTSQITNFPTLGTASTKDVPASGDASSTEVVMGDDTRLTDSRTPTAHTHGNIQNGGTLQTDDVTIASGDKLVITDSSDGNKIARTSVLFDGVTDNKALTQKGTWEYFGGVEQTEVGTGGYEVVLSNNSSGDVKKHSGLIYNVVDNITQGQTLKLKSAESNNIAPQLIVWNETNSSAGYGDIMTIYPDDIYIHSVNSMELHAKTWDGANESLRSAFGSIALSGTTTPIANQGRNGSVYYKTNAAGTEIVDVYFKINNAWLPYVPPSPEPTPSEVLLYDWDFTESMIDSVDGLENIPGANISEYSWITSEVDRDSTKGLYAGSIDGQSAPIAMIPVDLRQPGYKVEIEFGEYEMSYGDDGWYPALIASYSDSSAWEEGQFDAVDIKLSYEDAYMHPPTYPTHTAGGLCVWSKPTYSTMTFDNTAVNTNGLNDEGNPQFFANSKVTLITVPQMSNPEVISPSDYSQSQAYYATVHDYEVAWQIYKDDVLVGTTPAVYTGMNNNSPSGVSAPTEATFPGISYCFGDQSEGYYTGISFGIPCQAGSAGIEIKSLKIYRVNSN